MTENISKAFVKAQTAFAPALKSSANPHFKSKYADLAACVEAVIDALNANGIALMQLTHPCDSGVVVETVLLHGSGERLSGGTLYVPANKSDAQGYGSALTYARRYSLMATCGIAPEDDDGNAAKRTPPPLTKPVLTPADAKQWAGAKAAYKRDGNLSKVLEKVTMSMEDQKFLQDQVWSEDERAPTP